MLCLGTASYCSAKRSLSNGRPVQQRMHFSTRCMIQLLPLVRRRQSFTSCLLELAMNAAAFPQTCCPAWQTWGSGCASSHRQPGAWGCASAVTPLQDTVSDTGAPAAGVPHSCF